jgi:hypothetical protein
LTVSLYDPLIEVTHIADEPETQEIERYQAVDMWITLITTVENTRRYH